MKREELLAVIEKAKRSGRNSLDLSGRGIKELPSKIGELCNLTTLNLWNNQLTTLPEAISELSNLTTLDLRSNQLTTLPEAIGALSNLTFLDLSENQLTTLPEWISQLGNLKFLKLRSNQLTTLPEAIGQLSNLTLLNLRSNQLTTLPEAIGQLSNLTSLYLWNNQLTTLPEAIGQLNNLTTLDLRNNRLTTVPEWISQLSHITSLNLSSNQLMTVPEWISQLSHITSLNLSSNQLTTLPDWISQLSNLTSLDLSSNQLTTLPDWISQLSNLTSLDLRSNQLTTVPDWISQLSNLTSLDLSSNQLTTLPDWISQLSNLTSLNLRSNQLTTLPEWISQLSNLTSLNLRSNQLTTLPEAISQLSNLTSLYLSSNQLTTLPEAIGQLSNLTCLNLHSNQLTTLPNEIGKLTKLETLNLKSNLLRQIPPEVVKQGGLAVRDYYRQRLEANTDYIYEAKLLMIGEGGAGKTSLANKLIDSNYILKLESSTTPEKSTEGIDVLRLDFPHPCGKTFRINVWDFGGQEIYHATHQFFLTKRSLYLLVADTRQDNTDFNYWLEVVELLSDASPTLIIKNEKQDRPCEVNENQLRGRFSNLEKILATNLANNRGLSDIRTAVQHHISQLPHIGTPLPQTWVNVRKALETDPRNHISQDEFLSLCDTHGFNRRQDKLQLSGYLHDLGVCLHFQDDPVLKHVVILKPEWGTAAVYKVLDTPKVRANLGCFTQADLSAIWADAQYTDMRDELLQLMMRFKLCYEIPHRPKTYIAPQLLSANQPEYPWDNTDNLILRYHYDFMPKGMLTRFIVEMHRLIDGELVWKEGVILKDKNARAEVIEAYYKNEIRIRIVGKLKKPLLENIRHEFGKIHDSYNKPEDPPEKHRLRYQEFIPCNCADCKGSQKPTDFDLSELQARMINKRDEIECNKNYRYKMVNVRSLIDDAIGEDEFTRDLAMRDLYVKKDKSMEETPQSTVTNQFTIINKPEANAMTNQSQKINNFNGQMSGVIGSDSAQVSNNQFTQINNANTAELLQLIATMRQTATQFPKEIHDDIIIDIDDVETEIHKPESDRNLPKLRKRLIALAAAGSLIAAPIANMTDFVNNVTDLATKVGIELPSKATP